VKCAEPASRFTDIGIIDDAVDDEPNFFTGDRQFSPVIPGLAQLDEIPGK
jgi:hypothetical protein